MAAAIRRRPYFNRVGDMPACGAAVSDGDGIRRLQHAKLHSFASQPDLARRRYVKGDGASASLNFGHAIDQIHVLESPFELLPDFHLLPSLEKAQRKTRTSCCWIRSQQPFQNADLEVGRFGLAAIA
jgi:hypothetical protein